jgi:cytochrome c-type biogenesis protein CcmH
MILPAIAFIALTLAAPQAADPAALEREARQLETMLIAPCCWLQPVSQHQSQASDDVKQQIRVLLAAGKTRQEVLDAFAAQYGPRILAEPPATGVGRLLYVGMPLAFVLSAGALVLFLKKATARRRVPAAAPPGTTGTPADTTGTPDDAYTERLDDELRDMD